MTTTHPHDLTTARADVQSYAHHQHWTLAAETWATALANDPLVPGSSVARFLTEVDRYGAEAAVRNLIDSWLDAAP